MLIKTIQKWNPAYEEHVFAKQIQTGDEMSFCKNITISNFSYSTNYSLFLRISYYTNVSLDSDMLSLFTREISWFRL